MIKSVERKLLLSKTKPAQFFIALLGAFLGLFIVMAGVQVYGNMQELLTQKDMLGGDFLVINKKIGLLNTLSGTSPGFSEEEQHELQKQKGIDKLGVFTAGTFKALMEMDPKMADMAGSGFKTDLFFESVPDDFVDIDPSEWTWKNGESVPIIIPSDYIKLYNMAFAQSQGLPVIPESLIKTVTFKIRLRGQGKEEYMDGRIAGFSERINSILVPNSFLQWGNQNYGDGKSGKPSRIILHCTDPASPSIVNYIQAQGYEMNEEKLKTSKMNGILQIILTIVAFVGGLIVLLSLLGFMQYNQLLAYRSAYEIQTLHWLGYETFALSKPYLKFIAASILSTFLLAVIVTYFCQKWFTGFLIAKGFDVILPSLSFSLFTGFIISMAMIVLSAFAAHKQVLNLAK